MVNLPTQPEHLQLDLSKAAIVVVDMQNAFATQGGLLDLAGHDISGAAPVIRTIGSVLDAARASGVQVVYLQTGYKPDLSNGGDDTSPNPRKETALCLMRVRPELKGQLLVEGTWDFQIVDELAPVSGDLVVLKTRYSGFARTTLDAQLRERGIRYLIFVGIATNVCVESTLRDAYFNEYWPILVTDGAMQAGPPEAHAATIFNVESFFGWTLPAANLCAVLQSQRKATSEKRYGTAAAAMLVAALSLTSMSPTQAQVPGFKLPNGTVVPDMGGIWERIEGIRFNPKGELPPFNEEYRQRYELAMQARNRGERVADPTYGCLPQGMPRFMVASYPLEVLQTKGQITIIAEWSSQVRRIFTDGRTHPPADEIDITFNGHSIGRWEGQTLVVDTVGIRGDTSFDASPMTHSEQLTVNERIYLKDPKTLVAELTITDPGAFTAPWKVTRTYRRGGPDARIMEYVCEENNREIILPGQNQPKP